MDPVYTNPTGFICLGILIATLSIIFILIKIISKKEIIFGPIAIPAILSVLLIIIYGVLFAAYLLNFGEITTLLLQKEKATDILYGRAHSADLLFLAMMWLFYLLTALTSFLNFFDGHFSQRQTQ